VLVALNCGKPVLVEKPMAINAGEAQQMLQAATQKNLLLGVAQIFRFAESVRRLRERIAAGEIGRLVLARSEFSFWGVGAPRTWIHDAAIAGGGPIADIGVHCIDALRFILRDEVATVSARGIVDQQSGSVESAAAVTLEFRRSGLATVLVSFRSPYRTPMELAGQWGVLRAEDALSVDKRVRIELLRENTTETEEVSNQLAYCRQVDAFAAAVEDGVPFPAPAEEGWKNQVILDAAYRSMKTGRTEAITEF
jgi:predicted dehydrogenase